MSLNTNPAVIDWPETREGAQQTLNESHKRSLQENLSDVRRLTANVLILACNEQPYIFDDYEDTQFNPFQSYPHP